MVVVELRTQFIMKGITLLSAFEWDKATRPLLYGQADYAYDKPLTKPELEEGNPIRLYTLDEIAAMTEPLGMQIQ